MWFNRSVVMMIRTSDYQEKERLAYAAEVQGMCARLFKQYPVDAFAYGRLYPDGKHWVISSDPLQRVGGIPQRDAWCGQKLRVVEERVGKEDVQPCLYVLDYLPQYTECCVFYSRSSSLEHAMNAFLNDLDALLQFRRFFRHRAKELISVFEKKTEDRCGRNARDRRALSPVRPDPLAQARARHRQSMCLTPKEEEVAQLLCEGLTAKESAACLSIHPRTVEKHIERIKSKSACRRRGPLIHYLQQQYSWCRELVIDFSHPCEKSTRYSRRFFLATAVLVTRFSAP